MTKMIFEKNSITAGLQKFFEMYKNQSEIAKKKVALQLLNFVSNGSSKTSVVPPKRFGQLRASGSVFVGSELVKVTTGDKGTPAKDHTEPDDMTITVGFNTPYAARMHESLEPSGAPDPWVGRPLHQGIISQQSGDVDAKFLEKHIEFDGPTLCEMYANIIKEKFA
jgi:hypothetical protein